jgi:hypothetical protein
MNRQTGGNQRGNDTIELQFIVSAEDKLSAFWIDPNVEIGVELGQSCEFIIKVCAISTGCGRDLHFELRWWQPPIGQHVANLANQSTQLIIIALVARGPGDFLINYSESANSRRRGVRQRLE